MKEYEKFIRQIKKNVKKQPLPPDYNPEDWADKSFNCYLYVLRACLDVRIYDNYIVPGFLSRGQVNDYRNLKSCLLEYFMEDLEELGLNAVKTTVESKVVPESYKIAVYVKEKRDFHFARQDSNGKWSQKPGWIKNIELLDSNDVSKNIDGYQFLGVFRISKKDE